MIKFNKIINYLSEIDLSKKRIFIRYLNLLKKKSINVSNLSSNKLELEKAKLDLMKLYYRLGKYVSKKNYNESISDFSYDEEYLNINNKINKLKSYIKK